MKPIKPYILSLFAAAVVSVATTACKDDIINIDDPNVAPSEDVSGDAYYMALRVYNAAAIEAGTRATHDSDDKDYPENGKPFNTGLANENALCPATSSESSPHFLLVFEDKEGSDDSKKLEYLFPLINWDYEKNGSQVDNNNETEKSGYVAYYTFYTSLQRPEIPKNIGTRTVCVVLNAGEQLKANLKAAVGSTYSDVMSLTIQDPDAASTPGDGDEIEGVAISAASPADYLFCTDSDGTKYFTMTSSIVAPLDNDDNFSKYYPKRGETGPAVIKYSSNPFTWYPTKDQAATNPIFTFFLERMQAKFTLTFEDQKGVKHYLAESGELHAGDDGFWKQSHIVFKSGVDFNPTQEIKYVKTFTPRTADAKPTYTIEKAASWKINIMGWGVNAVESKENIFKKIGASANYFTGWNTNAYSHIRNFWAEDLNYSSTAFPDQYREARTVNANGEIVVDRSIKAYNDVTPSPSLTYFNFSELTQPATHQYSPENTFSTDAFIDGSNTNSLDDVATANKSQAYMRAGTHLILTSQLLIEEFDDAGVYKADSFNSNGGAYDSSKSITEEGNHGLSKYLMNDIFWSEEAYLEYVAEYLGYWMQEDEETFGKNDGIFYYSPPISENNPRYINNTYLKVEPLYAQGADGWVHIIPDIDEIYNNTEKLYLVGENIKKESQLTEEEKDDEKIEDKLIVFYSKFPNLNTDDAYKPITRAMFEVLALSHPEYFAQHYNRGRMYYAIPVQHYDNNGMTNLVTGKYGVVRNHWYSFNVTNFSGVGTPVDVPEQKIIPNNERSFDQLGITLSILPWHVMSEEVDITEQRPGINISKIDEDLKLKANDWNYSPDELDAEDGF
ncbi:MAG: Mfa1 fimbrilin C-terminal domain-containing protein [Muribaculaceae bacterium]|nr:Mfa1 fimbrilin C-terminal domain-containing protein [Muribaculaceae bacterium]